MIAVLKFRHTDEDETIAHVIADMQDTLRKIMQAEGVSEYALAERMNVDPSNVQRIFTEKTNVSIRELTRVAFHLGVRPVLQFNRMMPDSVRIAA